MIDLKTLSIEQLNLVLHNMRIYRVDIEKQNKGFASAPWIKFFDKLLKSIKFMY